MWTDGRTDMTKPTVALRIILRMRLISVLGICLWVWNHLIGNVCTVQPLCSGTINSINKVSSSRWPRGLRRGSVAVRLLELQVRIPPGASMFASCEYCVLSGRGVCHRAHHSSRDVLPSVWLCLRCAPDGHLQSVTIPDDLLIMSTIVLETCRGI